MTKICALAILLLTGCSVPVELVTFNLAEKVCVSNGGLQRIVVNNNSYSSAYCNNKAVFYSVDKELKNK